MSELDLHGWVVTGVFASALATVVVLMFVSAPYGRHSRVGWGPTMPSRWAWIVMETPAVVLFVWIYLQGDHAAELAPLVMLGLWQLHYVHRTYIFPFRMRTTGKTMPILVMTMGLLFQCVNSTLNARWISHLGSYQADWVTDPRFVCGVLLFLIGWTINLRADTVLLKLRRPGDSGYHIPQGALYRYVSNPNYLGELIEWSAFALVTWSTAGLSFAVYTAANLVPRALSNHRWYQEKFPDYPSSRRAILPFVL